MSSESGARWPVAGFCDVEGGIWGVVVGGRTPALAIGELSGERDGAVHYATDALDTATGEWRLRTEIGELQIAGPAAGGEGLVPCRASGTLSLAGAQRTIDVDAVRCASPPLDGAGSLRLVASWFADNYGVALLACRPRGASGQDRDAMLVDVHGESDGVSAFDPRLSTTYAPDMSPLRMGIELWLGEHEDGDLYPRRVAGERSGPGLTARRDGVRIDACALRCHSRGDEGCGVYLLVATA